MLDIGSLCGSLWRRLSSSDGFVSGVFSALTGAFHRESRSHAGWYGGQRRKARREAANEPVPCVAYFLRSHLEEIDGKLVPVSDVRGVSASAEDLLGGTAELGAESLGSGYVLVCRESLPAPSRITAHVLDNDVTLIRGLDYEWFDGELLLHADPEKLGLPTVTMTGESGFPVTCYRAFCWVSDLDFDFDPLALGEGPGLQWDWETAWDMHQNGASLLSVKRILAGTCGSVVALEDGVLEALWTEQGRPRALAGGRVYSGLSGQSCNFRTGAEIRQGDVLFGGLAVASGTDDYPEGLFGDLQVSTDAGELTARDAMMESIAVNGAPERILPLTGDPQTVARYRKMCLELIGDPEIPRLDPGIPAQVNPMRYIAGTLRGSWQLLIRVPSPDLERLDAALGCIRRNMKAGCMLSVLVSGEEQTASLADFDGASYEVSAVEA